MIFGGVVAEFPRAEELPVRDFFQYFFVSLQSMNSCTHIADYPLKRLHD